ncbi:hypothetical protein MBLNU230_g2669t1 [Neophaeotheca triangularis]
MPKPKLKERLKAWKSSRAGSPLPPPSRHTVSPPAPTATTTATSTPTASATSLSSKAPGTILSEALAKLTPDEQQVVRQHAGSTASDAAKAVDEVYAATRLLQPQDADRSRHWIYNGRKVYLKDQTDKVLRFLDKFKAVGDVISSADPVHVGLPWVGVRVLLQVALSDREQQMSICTGLELALQVSSRLKVYIGYHEELSASPSKENLREALVNLYSHILRFLANAIGVYAKGSAARAVHALWSADNVATFEEQCDKLCIRAETEASNCDRDKMNELSAKIEPLKDIHSIQSSIAIMQDKLDLSNLVIAHEATHDSFDEGELPRCLPGTRTDLLDTVTNWASDPNSKKIFWLCGKAGTGKSTISRTVAENLKQAGLLGASFFFKKGHETRSNAKLLFPTLADQLVRVVPGIRQSLVIALDKEPNLCHQHLKAQFDGLLGGPFQNLKTHGMTSKAIVVVIDALDECAGSESIRTVLRLLSQIGIVTSIRLLIFVTSRPEVDVESGFSTFSRGLLEDVRLENVQASSIRRDIQIFYQSKFADVRQSNPRLPSDWPSKDTVNSLVKLTEPLFIFAATVVRYISERYPRQRLELMMKEGSSTTITGIESTYRPILDQSLGLDKDRTKKRDNDIIAEFQTVVGPIVLLFNPLTVAALEILLAICIENIETVLKQLHSVLMVPKKPDGLLDETKEIRLFHLSFRDYLLGCKPEDGNQFWIDETKIHSRLAERCIDLLNSGALKEDVCDLGAPGTARLDVPMSRIEERLPAAVAYACRYWVHHVIAGEDAMTGDQGPVHQFLLKHFLHWTEAMSWLGKAADVIRQLAALKSRIKVGSSAQSRMETKAEKSPGLVDLIEDLSRFILMNRPVIDEAPLQTYLALIFTPSQSLTRQLFRSTLEQTFEKKLKVPEYWSNERLRLHLRGVVTSMDFSADGSILVTGSRDGAVRLWSTETGQEILNLTKGRDLIGVRAVVISADGKKVVSYHARVFADPFQELVLWFTDTGEKDVLHSPGSFYSDMTSIAISGDSKTIASCWIDGPRHKGVKSREIFVDSGEVHHRFSLVLAENNPSKILALSHDGTVLAVMGPPIGSLLLFNTAFPSLEPTLEIQLPGEHEWKIFFGREGNTLIALFQNGDLRYWDVNSGRELSVDESAVEMRHLKLLAQELVAFSWEDRFGVVAICPKSCTLARKSEYMVGLYDVSSGFTIPLPKGQDTNPRSHMKDRILDVAYSPDGTFVASVGTNSQVAFWNTSSGTLSHAFEILTGAVVPYPDLNVLAPILGEEVRSRNMRLLENGTAGELDQMHPSHAREVAFSCDGNRIAIIASFVVCKRSARIRTDYYLLVWITATGELHSVSQLPNCSICLSFHPHGRILAIGGANGRVDTVSVDDGRTLNTVGQCSDEEDPGGKGALSVAFSPNGDLLASFLVDSGVTVWGTSDYSVVFCQGTVGRLGDLMSVREKFLRFSGDSTVVASHEGRFRVDTEVPESQASEEGLPLAVVNQFWIVLRGERFLFLPEEYRGSFFDARGSSLAIGRQDEKELSLFDFAKWAKLESTDSP